MKIETIQNLLAELNAASTKKKPAAKKLTPTAAPAVKTNGHTHLSAEESLALSAKRIAAAFDLGSRGVTAEKLVARVHFVESLSKGVVQ